MTASLLKTIEPQIDADIEKLDLWNADALCILTHILREASSKFTGGIVGFSRQNPDHGAMILSRLSHLISLVQKSEVRKKARVLDIDCGLSKKQIDQIPLALNYAHFCEIMPEVRRFGHDVSIIKTQISITHRDAEFEKFEERDVVASEFSTAFTDADPRIDPKLATKIMLAWPDAKESDVLTLLGNAYDTYLKAFREDEYLPKEKYEEAFGFSREAFAGVRASLGAFGFFCRNLAVAASARAYQIPKQKQKWYRKAAWWGAPVVPKTLIQVYIQKLTNLDVSEIDLVLKFFLEPLDSSSSPRSGEGFLTPLFDFQDDYLIAPPAALLMMCERNLLYLKNQFDRGAFNNIVSSLLEPSLIKEAEKILGTVDGLRLRSNVKFANREIDLLLFSGSTNTALQLQAKACIPAQGARMTRQIENTTLTAVEQLKVAESLTQAERDAIIYNAFGIKAKDVSWSSGVLSRSSFGTSNAWRKIGKRAALNPLMLRIIAKDDSWKGDLTLIADLADKHFDGLSRRTSKGWSARSFSLSSYSIEYPMLDLDYLKCFEARFEIWK